MNTYPQQAWYIACKSSELKKKAIARTINNLPLVIWRDKNHQVVAFLDKCPHRNVPLSEGYANQHHLVCPYHGWEFDSEGTCQHQPGNLHYQNQPQHNLIKYPAIEQHQHIWIYTHPEFPPSTLPYQLPYINEPGFTTFNWEMTSPATLENIAENFLDATHTHFIHAGLIRTPQQRQPITVQITRNQEQVEATYANENKISGLIYRLLAPGCQQVISIGRFILPSIAQLEYKCDRENFRLFISLILTPISANLTKGYIFVTFRWGLPNWLGKIIAKPLFYLASQQDQKILNRQFQNLQKFGREDFTITEIDVIKPHITYLLQQASSKNHKNHANFQKIIKINL